MRRSPFHFVAVAAAATLIPTAASAADGCKFLLCIAGPWQRIAECRPTVYEVFADLARGKSFPTCAMSGEGNSAGNAWVTEATCPIMYRRYNDGAFIGCTYPGLISVYINGSLWSKVYWNRRGDTSTWYSETALASLTQPGGAPLDDTFQVDVGAWNATQVSACTSGGGTPEFGEYGAYVSCKYPDWFGG